MKVPIQSPMAFHESEQAAEAQRPQKIFTIWDLSFFGKFVVEELEWIIKCNGSYSQTGSL